MCAMRVVTVLAAAVALAAVCATAGDVVTATAATFADVVGSAEIVLVEFYAPWCGHCKKLAPVWEQAATELKGAAVLAQVDATVEGGLAQEHGVRGYPTIKVFRDGVAEGTYEGGREVADIVAYARAQRGPAVVRVTEPGELDAVRAEHDLVIVGTGAAVEDALAAVARKLRGTAGFVFASGAAAGAEAAALVAHKRYDEGRVVATAEDAASAEALEAFVLRESLRVFDEMGPANYRKYLERGLPIAWLFVRTADGGAEREWMADVARRYKGRMSFVWVDAEKYGGIAERVGLSGKVFPAFAVDVNQSRHYAYDEAAALEAEAVATFVDGVLSGAVAPTVRSEEAPEVATVDGLTTVVGRTFDELVGSADVDVLVEFYAPWCGHCKSFAPTYAAVARALADDARVRVAKFDAVANDFDMARFPVRGFPTMYFVKRGGAAPEEYRGAREEAALTEFVRARVGGAEAESSAGAEL